MQHDGVLRGLPQSMLGFAETPGGKRQRLSTDEIASPGTLEYLEGCRAGLFAQPRHVLLVPDHSKTHTQVPRGDAV